MFTLIIPKMWKHIRKYRSSFKVIRKLSKSRNSNTKERSYSIAILCFMHLSNIKHIYPCILLKYQFMEFFIKNVIQHVFVRIHTLWMFQYYVHSCMVRVSATVSRSPDESMIWIQWIKLCWRKGLLLQWAIRSYRYNYKMVK